MAISRMHNASGHNYRNSSFNVDMAMGQIPYSTERISINNNNNNSNGKNTKATQSTDRSQWFY